MIADTGLIYTIKPKNPGAHLFEVTLTVVSPDPDGQCFSLPTWIPGSYLVRDFVRHIVTLKAFSGDTPVAVEKTGKSEWRCESCSGSLRLEYEVYAWDLSVRGAHLDTTHGFFNGTSMFVCVTGREDHACTVEIQPPDGPAYADWRVATAMSRAGAPEWGFGCYTAQDYDELIDHPVEMGVFDLYEWEACDVPHAMAITGRHDTDGERLATDLIQICEHHIRFFGVPAPMDRYLFLTTALGDGYGGLEHRASSALMCKRSELPRAGMMATDKDYRRFLGLCSHEYFHTWNVKRIKPEAFTPYDLSRETPTELMWVFEGITSYYDDLALLRSGLISRKGYLELVAETITRVMSGAGRSKQSLAESSFDAWTKFYKQDENSPNAIVSYYQKGSLVALALDLMIRRDTQDKWSLDDVMRELWQRHGKTGHGVAEEGLEQLVLDVTGLDFSGFFDTAIRGTDDLPLTELLSDVGIELCLRAAISETDTGGKPMPDDKKIPVYLGIKTRAISGLRRIDQVFDASGAQDAGVSAGDILVAIDGIRVTAKNYPDLLHRLETGSRVAVAVFRRDVLMDFEVEIKAAPKTICYLVADENAAENTRARRAAWLHES